MYSVHVCVYSVQILSIGLPLNVELILQLQLIVFYMWLYRLATNEASSMARHMFRVQKYSEWHARWRNHAISYV